MKLNNFTPFLKIQIIILLILLYHYYIQNSLEKNFFDLYLNYDIVKRPLYACNSGFYNSFRCLGFPSRHTELASILFFILYFQKFISLPVCIILILCVALQRIIVHMHTFIQITFAGIFGFLYSQIYVRSHFSVYSFLLVFLIGILLSGLSVYKIDQLLKEPIPAWVDKKMLPDIKAKMATPYYLKILSMYAAAKEKGITYVSWYNLEDYLDKIIEKIQQSGVQFDAVIGIKTGGAIISDYVSQKLGLPNYKVKISRSEYNCNKKSSDTVNDIIQRQVLNNYGNYTICEGIQDDLTGKHVILIDEMVSSGKTMLETIQYLRREKHVNTIYPTCISLSKKKYKKDVHINHVLQDLVFVWPWGYDN